MHAVWLANGKVMKPYTVQDLQNVLGKLTNPKFAAEFYTKYIYGIEKNNYEALLAKAGFAVRKAAPGKAWSGLATTSLRARSGQARTLEIPGMAIVASTIMGTPLYKAGIDAGDVIVKVDGKSITDVTGFNAAVAAKNPGDKIAVEYKNRTGDHTTDVILEEAPFLEVLTLEQAGQTPTAEQTTFRNNWLSSKVK